ncbi:phosphotransferase family protein [Streptomyces platensis]|uniref:phosphotransferase family protein n=1 Tax=Streptomyces platensis TaxID=58346 RepID=UPI002E815052|nr:phosphotransferase [Streptomyces platensis]WUB78549.1 phosphotransferase [Streptomyces platensis]
MSRHLKVGERIVRTEALHGGITAEMRRLTVGTRDGGTRDLVLRSFVDPFYVEHAADWLNREAGALALLTGTGVPAPGLVAVDPTAARCAYPSLLMTHLAGRTVLDDEGSETRVPLLARQLVAIHALRPFPKLATSLEQGRPHWRPREYVAWTTADTVVPPMGADAAARAAAIDVIRRPAPAGGQERGEDGYTPTADHRRRRSQPRRPASAPRRCLADREPAVAIFCGWEAEMGREDAEGLLLRGRQTRPDAPTWPFRGMAACTDSDSLSTHCHGGAALSRSGRQALSIFGLRRPCRRTVHRAQQHRHLTR